MLSLTGWLASSSTINTSTLLSACKRFSKKQESCCTFHWGTLLYFTCTFSSALPIITLWTSLLEVCWFMFGWKKSSREKLDLAFCTRLNRYFPTLNGLSWVSSWFIVWTETSGTYALMITTLKSTWLTFLTEGIGFCYTVWPSFHWLSFYKNCFLLNAH